MTTQEIFNYNKNIHNLLGYKHSSSDKDFYFVEHPETKKLRELNFDRKYVNDWNYIMEIVEAIEKLPIKYYVEIKGDGCDIHNVLIKDPNFNVYVNNGKLTKKEAVVEAINQFLIWYEQNK